MVDEDKNKLRYTCMQRRFECGYKYAKQKEKQLKTNRIVNTETILSHYNSKSSIFKNFIKYIYYKNVVNRMLMSFYKKEIFRKLKWRTYIKIQKSVSKLINNIKLIFNKTKKKYV